MPKGLQLKFTLNAINQDRGLEARIQGILMQAKIEILEDIINHYEELSRNILQKLIELKTTILSMEEIVPNAKIIGDSKKETKILEDKLKSRRDDKLKNYESRDDRI